MSAATAVGRLFSAVDRRDYTALHRALVEVAEDRYECNVRGYHHLDGDTWMVAGWYALRTAGVGDRLVLAGITISLSYETGPRALIEQAQARAAGSAAPATPTGADRGGRGTRGGSG